MGHNDHIDFELNDALQDLLEENYFDEDSEEYQIIELVIDKGKNFLSDEQQNIFETNIADALKDRANDIRINDILNSNPD